MALRRAILVVLLGALSALAIRPDSGEARGMSSMLYKRKRDKQTDKERTNMRPIIGVVSQEGDPAPKGHTYIAASYIKFLEAAGARVIPILADMPPEEVERRFKLVNGILVPGGSQVLRPGHGFYDVTSKIFELTLKANDHGDFFPLHGTCLGFETLAVIASKNHSILSEFDAENLPSPLFPTDKAEKSEFFSVLPHKVYENLLTKPYAMENHVNGLAWTAIAENPTLVDFFDVLTLSIDRGGRTYVSTMEAIDYPITATQWHPEKNAYEWTLDKDIPHNPEAIVITQEVGNFFVNRARRNQHNIANHDDEVDLLIYNFDLVYTGKAKFEGEEVDFDESYFFPPWEKVREVEEAKRQARSA
ncbi:hypothetical protein APUTEX25_004217 [Auxenochlorella protothecoides]|uniref:folate gamma-glutamyl hydrolase n=1 Tax=Auxenochlorella protothecoides TaxID=3075 RepID=A0A1D2A896_AUXPR|nr:hypothetical protein APUTEX25_004217 [Auxenochlorella protothecoides]|eukprot:RMZ57383.1 hypothetical protein APUTEX25_004217 [Auxenochlorella protothecoides]